MFNDVARVDWAEHLPKLTAFWCRAPLSMPGYEGNPYRAHRALQRRHTFERKHFEQWLDLFHETLDLGWTGPKVEQAKALACKVAFVHSKQIIGVPVVFAKLRSDRATWSSADAARRTGARTCHA